MFVRARPTIRVILTSFALSALLSASSNGGSVESSDLQRHAVPPPPLRRDPPDSLSSPKVVSGASSLAFSFWSSLPSGSLAKRSRGHLEKDSRWPELAATKLVLRSDGVLRIRGGGLIKKKSKEKLKNRKTLKRNGLWWVADEIRRNPKPAEESALKRVLEACKAGDLAAVRPVPTVLQLFLFRTAVPCLAPNLTQPATA
eukprot:798761-Rhodomonas_salina.2